MPSSKQTDGLEPTLTRHGYTAKVLTEMLGTKPGEIKALFKQTLEVDRARELPANRRSRCSSPDCRSNPWVSKPVVCLSPWVTMIVGPTPMIAVRYTFSPPRSSGVGQGMVYFILLGEVQSQNGVKSVKDSLDFGEGSWVRACRR